MMFLWVPLAVLGTLPFLLVLRWSNMGHDVPDRWTHNGTAEDRTPDEYDD